MVNNGEDQNDINPPHEYALNDPPNDGITQITFHHSPSSKDLLIVSSWDSSCRLYDVQKNIEVLHFKQNAPVLSCCFTGDKTAACSGLESVVKSLDLESCTERVLGSHEKPARCICFCNELQVLYSGSWDRHVKSWDPRTSRINQPVCDLVLEERVYAMATNGEKVVVGTADNKINIYDVRNMSTPELVMDAAIKNQIRCLQCFPNKKGFVMGSIEGRVGIEYFDPEWRSRKYVFKCHRLNTPEGVEIAHPINSISFHPIYMSFATGGSDGLVNMWDDVAKKRLCQLRAFPTSISSLSFNSEGTLLAIASSYLYEKGEKDHPSDAIFIRNISANECKLKS